MRLWKMTAGIMAVGGGLAMLSISAAADTPAFITGPYQMSGTIHLGGSGRWDYALVDPSAKVVYVARQTHVQVVGTGDGKVVADLGGMRGNHGVALAPEQGRGFVSDGQANQVVVFDTKTYKELGKIPAGQNPDAIIYDPASHKVMAFDGRGKDVTVIDPAAEPGKGAVVGHIPLEGKPEFAAADGQGHVFVNIEDTNSISEIDSASMKVLATWKIQGGEGPSGLAIDPAHHLLFAGCDNKVMAVVDSQSGKTLGTVPIGEGVDACGFDPGTGEAFASCGDGTLTVVKETSPGKFGVEQTVQTRRGARTLALDPSTHTLYLPTAEMAEGNAGGGGRPQAKPDSFMLVVVTRGQKPQ
jgi:YVTN family beta-propeller protein